MKFPVKFHSLLSKIEISVQKFGVFPQLKKTWFIYLRGKNVRVLRYFYILKTPPNRPWKLCEILWNFVKLSHESFNRETAHFFLFLRRFQWSSAAEIGGFTCFWGKNLKPVVVSLKPEILAKPKFSGFNEIHHGVSSFYPQITREYRQFRAAEFYWIPYQKIKKYERVCYETAL